jgi:hypothetical protein
MQDYEMLVSAPASAIIYPKHGKANKSQFRESVSFKSSLLVLAFSFASVTAGTTTEGVSGPISVTK